MSKTLNSVNYALFSVEKDVVVLSDLSTNSGTVSFKRTAPKRQKDFPGMEKGEIKHTLVDPVSGAIIGIVNTSTSVLATATDAQRTSLIAVQQAILADSAFSSLVMDRQIPLAG